MTFQNKLLYNLSLLKISKAPKMIQIITVSTHKWVPISKQCSPLGMNTQLNIKNKCIPSNKCPNPPYKGKKRNCGATFSVYSLTLKAKHILIILFFLQHDTLFFVVVFCFYLMLLAKFMLSKNNVSLRPI